ncbi:hypothetical protein PFICI_03777 [Pestalotiopsis fici W106-1]|uniref:Uncharacterized protein n=1 Tax=Pestalotiopsis fici (strain W106-1 / CGMCC3.15140) TaxID=1229662 RepID=W3XJX3_PESFW|nr:uncharacterized protein PFICI_03777 [Pestalotiopsis fici W106-1]ETS85752.1 hypothetical protein PFICI_03777 [Pestalotiopsis fici W106-1]
MKASSIITVTLLQASTAIAQFWSVPYASVSWDNLQHIRVYAVDPNGAIREWQFDGNGWKGPSFIGALARIGTIVTAVNDGDRIRVYYQLPNGRAKERIYEGKWYDGPTLP